MQITRRVVLAGALAAPTVLLTRPSRSASRALRLRRGVNAWPWFSLTREFPAPRTDYGDPVYQEGRPVPHVEDLMRLAEAGFDFVRLPVDPGPLMASTATRRDNLLGAVMTAVDQILAAGLSVVVNLHGNAATHHWNPQRMYGGLDAPERSGFQALVGEFAARLASRDTTRIAFEPVNEPPQSCSGSDWNDLQASILEQARQAAPQLTLVATGACGSMIDGLPSLDIEQLKSLEPLFYTFHFYEPYVFSHQGAPWMTGEPIYRWLNGVPWPASAGSRKKTLAAVRKRMAAAADVPGNVKDAVFSEIEEVLRVYFEADPARWFVDQYLQKVGAWADAHAIPRERVLLGEFGALRTDELYLAAAAADRARYVRDVRKSAEAHGFAWAFWNLFDGMGLMDDRTREFDRSILAALGVRNPD
ncbi:glycoside hydrolase family 5 protein [Chthonobacter albigriseus]|uniref:glycoside hydrolase family 5 protein n=1 Tax=Chthonobacter albigriseus TaxID=1683161 RepID=UPI0015EF3A78|nr:cellulase family glycosylhydrolase [Chthonobacter albigriseus]